MKYWALLFIVSLFMVSMVKHELLIKPVLAHPPISKDQAQSMANHFFTHNLPIEGGIGDPYLKGDFWVCPVKVGAAAHVLKDPILINRTTGQIYWAHLNKVRH